MGGSPIQTQQDGENWLVQRSTVSANMHIHTHTCTHGNSQEIMHTHTNKHTDRHTHTHPSAPMPSPLPPCPFIPVWLERSVHVWEKGSQDPQTPPFHTHTHTPQKKTHMWQPCLFIYRTPILSTPKHETLYTHTAKYL